MPNYPQSLVFTSGCDMAWLREICGRQEQHVAGTDVTAAIALLDGLWVNGRRPGISAQDLPAPDRDRLLAAVYQQTYGDRIRGTLECTQCAADFDMDFSLGAFVEHTHATQAEPSATRLPDGTFQVAEGIRLRLPTGTDEIAVTGLNPEAAAQQLLQRCLVEGDEAQAKALPDDLLATAAPLLQADMAAQCPECGHATTIFFDMQTYLLQSLIQDRDRLTYEVHRLATAYGWSLKEILKLPRSQRRNYSRWIESEYATSF